MFAYESYDALVIGARCAGAATAMLMARKGLRVLAIDRAGYGTDTISTHALMRGGVLQLHRWGVLPHLRELGTPAVRETTFHYGDEEVTVVIRPANGVEALYAPRRTLLDRALVDAARTSGAVVRHGCSLVGLTFDFQRAGLRRAGSGSRWQRYGDRDGPSRRRGWHGLQRRAPRRSANRAGRAPCYRGSVRQFSWHQFEGFALVVPPRRQCRGHPNQSGPALHFRCDASRAPARRCRSNGSFPRDPARGRSGTGNFYRRPRAG